MVADIHVGDVGTIFRVTVLDEDGVVVDISAALLKRIILAKPDGSKTNYAASLDTDGTDGVMRYATVDGDLSVAGRWKVQGYVELTAGKWHTEIEVFKVKENL